MPKKTGDTLNTIATGAGLVDAKDAIQDTLDIYFPRALTDLISKYANFDFTAALRAAKITGKFDVVAAEFKTTLDPNEYRGGCSCCAEKDFLAQCMAYALEYESFVDLAELLSISKEKNQLHYANLFYAALYKKQSELFLLLVQQGLEVNKAKIGVLGLGSLSILACAILAGNVMATNVLLRAGAKLEYRTFRDVINTIIDIVQQDAFTYTFPKNNKPQFDNLISALEFLLQNNLICHTEKQITDVKKLCENFIKQLNPALYSSNRYYSPKKLIALLKCFYDAIEKKENFDKAWNAPPLPPVSPVTTFGGWLAVFTNGEVQKNYTTENLITKANRLLVLFKKGWFASTYSERTVNLPHPEAIAAANELQEKIKTATNDQNLLDILQEFKPNPDYQKKNIADFETLLFYLRAKVINATVWLKPIPLKTAQAVDAKSAPLSRRGVGGIAAAASTTSHITISVASAGGLAAASRPNGQPLQGAPKALIAALD